MFLQKVKGDGIMLEPINLIFPEDVSRLPSSILEECCLIAGFPLDDSSADRIYNVLSGRDESVTPEIRGQVYELVKDRIFAGRRGVTWHRLPEIEAAFDLGDVIRERYGVDPFERIIPRDPNNLDGTAKVIAACRFGNGRRYLLRYMVKLRVIKIYAPEGIRNQAIGATVSIIIDLDNRILEIRDDPRYLSRILREVSILFSGLNRAAIMPLRIPELLEPFGGQVESLAEQLGGRLTSTDSKPELGIENELTAEEMTAVSNVLVAVNAFFENNDYAALKDCLDESKAGLASFEGIPFLAILLAGLEKMGLSVKDVGDVRTQPLLNALRPHLQYQGGFINFPVNEGGVAEYHTIRVGLQTNSISFRTFASEGVIGIVRSALL
ncbi:MAG: hypothetical protein ACRKFN_11470 [Desulfitobacterium sp.]